MSTETAEIAPRTPPAPQEAKPTTTPDALTLKLYAQADKELDRLVDQLFAPLKEYRQCQDPNVPTGKAPQDKVRFNGYATAGSSEIWPPHIVDAAWDAVYHGAREKFREKFVEDFIKKVDSLQEQVEELSNAVHNG